MIIRYKTIIEERTEDAPFVGALICAIDCNINCNKCFNQHLKKLNTKHDDCENIISSIKQNPFNKGVILGGLEWTNQPKESFALIKSAISHNLYAMLYTGMNFDELKDKYQQLLIHGLYIKYGKYDETQKTINHIEYGVTLASKNQHIVKIN